MIAEAIDLGVVTVGGMVGVLGVVAAGAWWAASASAKLTAIAKDTRATARLFEDHRAEDDAKHAQLGDRLTRVEVELSVADRTPIRGIPLDSRPLTGPHERLRGPTPRPPRDSGDTDSGMDR